MAVTIMANSSTYGEYTYSVKRTANRAENDSAIKLAAIRAKYNLDGTIQIFALQLQQMSHSFVRTRFTLNRLLQYGHFGIVLIFIDWHNV